MSTAALDTYKEKLTTFKSELTNKNFISEIEKALPAHIDAQKMIRVCITAATKTPKLLDCDRKTVYKSIIECSQLGLMPDGITGEAYLIPFNNRRANKLECQIIVGYRGLMKLARNTDEISSISAHVIHSKDEFHVELGDNEKIHHIPRWKDDDPGEVVGAYAICHFKNGGIQRVIMNRRQIDGIRARSKSGSFSDSPWATDYEEMAKKTVIRRLSKLLPMSSDLAKALDKDHDRTADPLSASIILGDDEDDDTIDVTPKADNSKLGKLTQEMKTQQAEEKKSPPKKSPPKKKEPEPEPEEDLPELEPEEDLPEPEDDVLPEPDLPEPEGEPGPEPEPEPEEVSPGELASPEQLAFIDECLLEMKYNDKMIQAVLKANSVKRFSDMSFEQAERLVKQIDRRVKDYRKGKL